MYGLKMKKLLSFNCVLQDTVGRKGLSTFSILGYTFFNGKEALPIPGRKMTTKDKFCFSNKQYALFKTSNVHGPKSLRILQEKGFHIISLLYDMRERKNGPYIYKSF